jgi:hypothetical protein
MQELIRARPRESAMRGDRLNLVVSSVATGSTFGGVQTAIDLFRAMTGPDIRRRILSAGPVDDGVAAAFPDFRVVDAGEDPDDLAQIVSIAGPGGVSVPVGPRDAFLATFWPTAAFALEVGRWQEATYGRRPGSMAYLIQDYEPGFYPRSSQYLMARATYDAPDSTIAIFNTDLLQADFHEAGIRFASEFTFEPRLSLALRAVLDRPAPERVRRIVVYGRPSKPRNAFSLIVDGLRAWRASAPDVASWSIVSVGEDHVDIDLGGGVVMSSLGKLTLDAYADLIRTSAIGVSMMISPHPSYPPLEMAHLGLLVVTNRFAGKDLASWHTNIASLASLTERGFAEALADACRRFDADPTVGDRGRLLHKAFLEDGPQFPFAADVAARLHAD